jgi:hypothetical protein
MSDLYAIDFMSTYLAINKFTSTLIGAKLFLFVHNEKKSR